MKFLARLTLTSYTLLFLLLPVLAPSLVSAAATAENCKPNNGPLAIPTWYKYLKPTFLPADPNATPPRTVAECKIQFPPNEVGEPDITLAAGPVALALFEILLFIAGILSVAYVIYGGFQYIIGQGEPDRMKNARTTILNAIIGLIITMLASAIVNLIGRNIT